MMWGLQRDTVSASAAKKTSILRASDLAFDRAAKAVGICSFSQVGARTRHRQTNVVRLGNSGEIQAMTPGIFTVPISR